MKYLNFYKLPSGKYYYGFFWLDKESIEWTNQHLPVGVTIPYRVRCHLKETKYFSVC